MIGEPVVVILTLALLAIVPLLWLMNLVTNRLLAVILTLAALTIAVLLWYPNLATGWLVAVALPLAILAVIVALWLRGLLTGWRIAVAASMIALIIIGPLWWILSLVGSRPDDLTTGGNLVELRKLSIADRAAISDMIDMQPYTSLTLVTRVVEPANSTAVVTVYGLAKGATACPTTPAGDVEVYRLASVSTTWTRWQRDGSYCYIRVKVEQPLSGNGTPASAVDVLVYLSGRAAPPASPQPSSPTATATGSPESSSPQPTATLTPTSTGSPALTTMTPTLTPTPTGSPVPPSTTPTPTSTGTQVPPSATPTPTSTLTPTATATPEPPTPSPSPTVVAEHIPQPPALVHDDRYFTLITGFRVEDDRIWDYFSRYGGVTTFGPPVSRTFTLLGCTTQLFQRQGIHVCDDGVVQLLNLLDPDLLPVTQINGSEFPKIDDEIKARTPRVGDPGYDAGILALIHQLATDTYQGRQINFDLSFRTWVTPELAGTTDSGIRDMRALEFWGAPTSRPQADPRNPNFVYQRFQRGIMHYDGSPRAVGILMADYLKQVMLGRKIARHLLPADLVLQTQGNRFADQYCPEKPESHWVCDPLRLPATDLTFAFEPG